MAQAGVRYPSVFVVDRETLPPLPPKPGHLTQTRRTRLIQNTLLVLVCIALCAVTLEAVFIYKLYNKTTTPNEPKTEAQKDHSTQPQRSSKIEPNKPLAHMTAGGSKGNEQGVMMWDEMTPSLHQLSYKDGQLQVQKEGFYYIYSKVCFSTEDMFFHTVMKSTPRYLSKPIELMRSRNYKQSDQKNMYRNSFLAGTFHLFKNDAVFVHVNKSSMVRLQTSADNYFGMFML